jgi:hypothetical protein
MWHHTDPGRFVLKESWSLAAKCAAVIIRDGAQWKRTDSDGRTWRAGSWTELMEVRK